MKYLLSTFENIHADCYEIMKSRGCILNHSREIELQTKYVNICFHCCITYAVKTNILEPIYKSSYITYKIRWMSSSELKITSTRLPQITIVSHVQTKRLA